MAASREERWLEILRKLEEQDRVSVDELSSEFGISGVSIRKDLDALAAAGKLQRIHGGALSFASRLSVSLQDLRMTINADAKRSIAQAALDFVSTGDAIFVDSGTTALEFVRLLAKKPAISSLTVVTSDLTIADFLDRAAPHIEVLLLGGHLRKAHRYTSGSLTRRMLEFLHTTKAFIVPTAYVVGRGFMTNNQAMAELKAAAISNASESYMLMNAEKIGAPGLMWFANMQDISTLITNENARDLLSQDLLDEAPRLIITG